MSLQPLIPYLIVALAASVLAMVGAAANIDTTSSALAAGLFGLAIVVVSLRINLPLIAGRAPVDAEAAIHASRRNARLMALTYAWGGIAMLAVHFLSGLWWWHSWQYGSLMALIAAALIAYVHQVGDPESHLRAPAVLDRLAWATAVQGLGAALGVAWLIRSGKPWFNNTDWVANHIFLAGGATIAVISAIAFLTHRRIAARARAGSAPLSGA
jgi:hypothetical protein